MPKITKEEYLRRALSFVEAHKDSYTQRERDYITKNFLWSYNKPYASDIIRQIYDEVGICDPEVNMYEGFLKIIEENFDINTDIIEVGGGIVPSLAKKIALRQKTGTVTVYDPRLMTNIDAPDNLILKKEKFRENTPIGSAKLIIGFMPCDAAPTIVKSACENQTDFIVALCEGGMREGFGWLEEDDEWTGYITYCAEKGIEKHKLGTLAQASLEKYNNPYPIIYNKRIKS
jgi:hypothetical protein